MLYVDFQTDKIIINYNVNVTNDALYLTIELNSIQTKNQVIRL